ncbi:hypothetical protein AQ505_11435 [Pedobacter sp. PACM 27299]|uniref:DUF5689 domain-containing protein n=1 Tax=Pedobacter sp. PACM 27299 TaxID=1727164 RepID=UPI000706E7D2|nr:DUF5689 domain-containing protein [Pedobacter sp. PACM 27299]ALL06049.1 hypothetical protein AQ505_11435 [Pedobacter sp. PACM 27299]
MKRIYAGHPVTLSMLLIFIAIMASCSKAKNEEQEFIPIPDAKQISIAYVKALSTAELIKIKDEGVIRGVVISDASSKNLENNRTLFLQEGNGKSGLMIELKAAHNFILNDSLEINIFDQTLTKLNGTVVLQDLATNLVKKVGVGHIIPRITTVRELQANKKDWEGSLIRISPCELSSDNGNYSGKMKIRDGKVTLASYILADAVFNNQELPQEMMSILGIVRLNGNEVQLAPVNMREILPLKYVVDEFTKWTNTGINSIPSSTVNVMQTEVADWYGDPKEGAIKQLANSADLVFTKPGKIYPYLPKDSIDGFLRLQRFDKLNLKGLKVMEVTFAASKSMGITIFSEMSGNQSINLTLLPFNTGIDEVNIGISIKIGNSESYRLTSLLAPIKETGKFYTAKFIIPSSLEDLIAMGISAGKGQEWLENPKLDLINLSSRKTPGISTYYRDRYIPMIIDKVKMGF